MRSMIFVFLVLVVSQTVSAQGKEEKSRLISTNAGVTDIILALGYGAQLVAVDITSDVPEELEPLPRIGYHRQLSAEGLLSLKPEVVFGSKEMGPDIVINALNQASVDVVQLEEAFTKDDLINNINVIAESIGCTACATGVASDIDEKYQKLIATESTEAQNYVFVMNMGQRGMRYAGEKTGGDTLIKLLGGINVAAHEGYRSISGEGLMSLNPDVILITGNSNSEQVIKDFKQQNLLLANRNIVFVNGKALIAGLSILTLDEALNLRSAGL